MKNNKRKIFNINRLIGLAIILFILVSVGISIKNNYSKIKELGFTGSKKGITIKIPNEYILLFNESNTIKNLDSWKPLDSSFFPMSDIKINEHQFATIFKFKSNLPLQEILKIKKGNSKVHNMISYEFDNYGKIILKTAKTSLSKKIDKIEITINGKLDIIKKNENQVLINGELSTLSFKLSNKHDINSIYIEKNNFIEQPKYSLAILKKNKSIYIIFFPLNKISKKEFENILK